jgi:DNA-binding protein YbaB
MADTGYPEIDRELDKIRAQLDSLQDVQSRMQDISGTGQDEDGWVEVTVGSTGDIQQLYINPRAMRLDSTSLAEAVLAAIKQAHTAMRESMMEILEPLLAQAPMVRRAMDGSPPDSLPDDLAEAPRAVSRAADPMSEALRQMQKLRNMLG